MCPMGLFKDLALRGMGLGGDGTFGDGPYGSWVGIFLCINPITCYSEMPTLSSFKANLQVFSLYLLPAFEDSHRFPAKPFLFQVGVIQSFTHPSSTPLSPELLRILFLLTHEIGFPVSSLMVGWVASVALRLWHREQTRPATFLFWLLSFHQVCQPGLNQFFKRKTKGLFLKFCFEKQSFFFSCQL